MRIIRHGIGILALAFTVGAAGACSGNSNRTSPVWYPRAARGTVYSAPAKAKTKVKRDDRRGAAASGDRGLHRGHAKNKARGNDNANRGNGNRGNNKSKGRGND